MPQFSCYWFHVCIPSSCLFEYGIICRLAIQREPLKSVHSSLLFFPFLPLPPSFPPSPSFSSSSFISVPCFLISTLAPGFFVFFSHAFTFLYIKNFVKCLLRNIVMLVLINEYLVGLKCSPLCTLLCLALLAFLCGTFLFLLICCLNLCFILIQLRALLCRTLALWLWGSLLFWDYSLKCDDLHFSSVPV